MKERVASRTAEIKERITDRVKERVKLGYRMVINRFQAAVNRMERILSRIESRVARVKETKKVNTLHITEDFHNNRIESAINY